MVRPCGDLDLSRMLYTVNEATFDLPAELHDRSVNVFTATPSRASPFNIVITKSMIGDADLTLAEHVTREVASQQQTLAGSVHEWRHDHVVDGRPAEIAEARIGGPGGVGAAAGLYLGEQQIADDHHQPAR